MKRVGIPIFQTELRIYKADEKEAFQKRYGDLTSGMYGCSCNDGVWIGDNPAMDAIGTCYHEATHFVDWLLEIRLGVKLSAELWDHTELRAYMVQWVGDKIREYCCD